MLRLRWLRLPRVEAPANLAVGSPAEPRVDPWLDTIHRLAAGRAVERGQLAVTGRATRARLRGEVE